jgi:Cytochrome C oxidase, cbb3-type, subunit III
LSQNSVKQSRFAGVKQSKGKIYSVKKIFFDMTQKLFVLIFMLLVVFACNNQGVKNQRTILNAVKLSEETPQQELVIDVQMLLSKQNKSNSVDVIIHKDPFLKGERHYLGYALADFLAPIIKERRFDTTGAVLIFDCGDGYKATMDIANVFNKSIKGYVAYKDKAAKDGKNWTDSLEARLSPSYVVWQNVDYHNHAFPWPFGVKTMRLIPAASEFKTIYPFQNPEFVEGFTLFKENCNKCHALNHVGGVMGPEFNVPKNITEYWRDEDILNFAIEPKSYRASSQMPSMKEALSVAEIKLIIDYLKFTAKHKVQ